jgi:drug/metabolite transporter (DMT)-like permease
MKLAAALVIVYVVWGSTYLGISLADRTLPPMLMLSVRFLTAGALLYAWERRRGGVGAAERPGRRQWGAAAIVGGLLLVVDTGAVAWALQRVSTGFAALLIASVPLFMAVVDRACFGIRVPAMAVAGIGTGLLGVAILANPGGGVDALGTIALLVAAFAWAAGSAYARVAPLPGRLFLSAAMQMLCAGFGLGLLGVATGELGRVDVAAISAQSLAALLYLIVFGSLLAFTVYGWLLKHAPTPLLSTYAYVNPAVAVFLGWAFVGEHVGSREIAAGLVILSSVAMLLLAREPRAEPEPIPESLPFYIRAKDAQVVEFRPAPRLAELHRISA